jgi:type IV pilus assembly protein PilA
MDVFDPLPWPEEYSTTLVELAVVLCVIGAMSWLLVASLPHLIRKTRSLTAVALAPAVKERLIEYRAVNGAWPTPDEAGPALQIPRHVRSEPFAARVHDAAVDYGFVDARAGVAPKSLTIRAWQSPDEAGGPTVWTCGHARAPAPMVALGQDRTTMPEDDLPSPCRRVR